MLGVTEITGKTKQVYQVAFSYMGVECRETVPGPHSKPRLLAVERLRASVLHAIAMRDFRYQDFFPDSRRARLFGHSQGKTQRLRDALEAYRDRVARTFEPSTFAGTRTAVDNVLIPWCGDITLGGLKRAHIRDWVSTQTTSLKRIRNVLLPLRAVLNEAVADEVIAANPLDGLDLAKLVPVEKRVSGFEPQPYTEAEIRAILANLPQPERALFQLWAYTGLRTGEVIGLRWPRVDLEANAIRVQETTTAGHDKARPKTPAGVRTIPLLPAAREAVDALRPLTQLAGDRVCVNPRGVRETGAWDDRILAKIWRRAHVGTGIAYRNPYLLRHTFASQLLSQGENAAYIAKLLGHKNTEMVTRVYGRWIAEGEKLGFDKPPRRYGMKRLWTPEICEISANPQPPL